MSAEDHCASQRNTMPALCLEEKLSQITPAIKPQRQCKKKNNTFVSMYQNKYALRSNQASQCAVLILSQVARFFANDATSKIIHLRAASLAGGYVRLRRA